MKGYLEWGGSKPFGRGDPGLRRKKSLGPPRKSSGWVNLLVGSPPFSGRTGRGILLHAVSRKKEGALISENQGLPTAKPTKGLWKTWAAREKSDTIVGASTWSASRRTARKARCPRERGTPPTGGSKKGRKGGGLCQKRQIKKHQRLPRREEDKGRREV